MLKKMTCLLAVLSIALSAVFIFGFVRSVNISSGPAEVGLDDLDDKNEENKDQLEESKDSIENYKGGDNMTGNGSDILIMGDSIGFGMGDEEGLGLGERYLNLMDEKDQEKTDITNISGPGYESGQLIDLIRTGEHDLSITKASLIVLSIGGNDINRLEYDDEVGLTIAFQDTLRSYRENLELVVVKVRELNPNAQLAIVGLYDPSASEDPERTRFLLDWNYQTRLLVESDPSFAYIPTYDIFKYHLDLYLSPDNFHPSALGYQAIAEELYRILN